MACTRESAKQHLECCSQPPQERNSETSRRDILAAASVLALGISAGLAPAPAQAEPADERPKPGDLVVAFDADNPVALEPKDIADGARQIFAWPMDPAQKIVRSGSRLNKLLLLRFDPATLTGLTRERAAEGVVAYSAICPHAGCEVSVWLADRKMLECPCHSSHYNPLEAGAVIDGPTMRALPALPLKITDGKLAVAKPFTSRPGIVQT
jgi:Rieske Fe-S protein